MEHNLITEITRIKEIIFGANIISEAAIPSGLAREIFDFALRQGDEFIELIRPIAQKEAAATGRSADDVIDSFMKQIDDYNAGFTTEMKFADDSYRIFLRNATTEEFAEFLLKAKIIPSNFTSASDAVVKKVADLGRKGTPVPEDYIDGQVRIYEDGLDNITFLDDELKQALTERFRKQLNVARVPSLMRVGSELTTEAVLRYSLGEQLYAALKGIKEFQPQLRNIESKLIGKTWNEAVDEATSRLDLLKGDENFKNLTNQLNPNQQKYLDNFLERLKNMFIEYKTVSGFDKEKPVYSKDAKGNRIIKFAPTVYKAITNVFVGLIALEFLTYLATKGNISGPVWMLVENLGEIIVGVKGGLSSIRSKYSRVSEEEAKNHLRDKMGLNLEDYSFEIDPRDEMKMTALYVGDGDGVDYLIYKENQVIKDMVYTEEYRNKTLLDIFK
jgi:hypothetical protein